MVFHPSQTVRTGVHPTGMTLPNYGDYGTFRENAEETATVVLNITIGINENNNFYIDRDFISL